VKRGSTAAAFHRSTSDCMAETTRTTAVDFVREVREQIQKVTWPDRDQLRESTVVIILFMVLVASVIFGMDLVVRTVLDLVASLFS
jgi:preprotein translocase subunit SecE